MSETTDNLDLPYLAASQSQKHVTVNEALAALDAVVQLSVLTRDLAAPPGAPAAGDRHIVGAGASGDWAGRDGEVAVWRDGAWAFHAPATGWSAWVAAEGLWVVHHGGDWRAGLAATANGAATTLELLEEEVTCAGASVDTTVEIPDRAIVFAVSTRTTEAIGGATSFDCGIAGETDKYGGSLGVAAGSTNSGVTGPTAFYAETAVRLTANGGAFSAGKVRVAIHFMRCPAPAA
jgi:hypothetical protein